MTKFYILKLLAEVHKSIRFNLEQKRKINTFSYFALASSNFPCLNSLLPWKTIIEWNIQLSFILIQHFSIP